MTDEIPNPNPTPPAPPASEPLEPRLAKVESKQMEQTAEVARLGNDVQQLRKAIQGMAAKPPLFKPVGRPPGR